MRRRDPICRRGSLIQRARNRRRQSTGGCLAGHGGNRNPLQSAARAKRPRRMGQCSEVADDGENLEDHPRPRDQIRPPQDPVSACKLLGRSRVEPFSFGPRQNLAWDIASLGEYACAAKRPYSACAAQRFSAGAEARPAPEFGRARGVEIPGAKILPCVCAAKCFQHGIMELCGSTPVLAEECGRFHESQRRRTYADEVANPRGSGSGNFGSATWSGWDRSRHGLRRWPCAASS